MIEEDQQTAGQRAPFTRYELSWFEYARGVVRDHDHLEACRLAGGALPAQPYPYDDLRWPGYIGSSYARILCLGMIHNADMLFAGRNVNSSARTDARSRAAAILDLENTALGWKDGSVSDSLYLAELRRVYGRALPLWNTWTHLERIVEDMVPNGGQPLTSRIAYANVAKCWSDTSDLDRSDYRVMQCCTLWPGGNTATLISSIQPLVVLVASQQAGRLIAGLPLMEDGLLPDVWAFNQRQGSWIDPKSGQTLRRREWAPLAAAAYRTRLAACQARTRIPPPPV